MRKGQHDEPDVEEKEKERVQMLMFGELKAALSDRLWPPIQCTLAMIASRSAPATWLWSLATKSA